VAGARPTSSRKHSRGPDGPQIRESPGHQLRHTQVDTQDWLDEPPCSRPLRITSKTGWMNENALTRRRSVVRNHQRPRKCRSEAQFWARPGWDRRCPAFVPFRSSTGRQAFRLALSRTADGYVASMSDRHLAGMDREGAQEGVQSILGGMRAVRRPQGPPQVSRNIDGRCQPTPLSPFRAEFHTLAGGGPWHRGLSTSPVGPRSS
jgi:hypothetical protein